MDRRIKTYRGIGIKVAVIIAFALGSQLWAGELQIFTGSRADRPSIWLGVGALVLLIGGFGALFWWLLLSRIKGATPIVPDLAPQTRKSLGRVGWAVLLSSLLFSIGGAADALQHALLRSLEFKFNDFFTAPHLVIYGSFLISAGIGGIVLGRLLAGGGDPRPRARRVVPLTIAALASAYLIASLPSDAVWHAIYGIDISAWSIPHILIALMSVVVSLAGAKLLLASRDPGAGKHVDVILTVGIPLLMAIGVWALSLMFTASTEWFGGSLNAGTPGWVRPFVVYAAGLFASIMTVNLTGRRWSATTSAVLVLTARLLLQVAARLVNLNAPMLILSPVFMLAPAFAVDIFYVQEGQTARFARAQGLSASLIYTAVYWIAALIALQPLQFQLADALIGAAVGAIFALVFARDFPALAKAVATNESAALPGAITPPDAAARSAELSST